jgi:hypothetical protein
MIMVQNFAQGHKYPHEYQTRNVQKQVWHEQMILISNIDQEKNNNM